MILESANAQTHTLAAATAHAAQIRRLQEAGARYIVVPNLPDLGVIPFAANLSPAARAALTALSTAYNEVVYTWSARARGWHRPHQYHGPDRGDI